MKKQLISFLADILPDSCPFSRRIYLFNHYLFTTPQLCSLNPYFKEVMEEKLRRLGYDT